MNCHLAKLRFPFLLLSLVLVAPCSQAQQKTDIPKATWEPIFFKSIDALTTQAGWGSLREARVPTNSLEVRVWIGFGLTRLQGIRIRRDGTNWVGFHAVAGAEKPNVRPLTPSSGWVALWTKLDALGIRTLPDDSGLPKKALVADGVSYVVEISEGSSYRTYRYANPQYENLPETAKVIEIANLLAAEIGTPPAPPPPQRQTSRVK